MTPDLLVVARAALDGGSDGPFGRAWPAAAALLMRQALEHEVDKRLSRFPGASTAPMAAKLAALRGLCAVDGEIVATWSVLSDAAHAGDAPREVLVGAWETLVRWRSP